MSIWLGLIALFHSRPHSRPRSPGCRRLSALAGLVIRSLGLFYRAYPLDEQRWERRERAVLTAPEIGLDGNDVEQTPQVNRRRRCVARIPCNAIRELISWPFILERKSYHRARVGTTSTIASHFEWSGSFFLSRSHLNQARYAVLPHLNAICWIARTWFSFDSYRSRLTPFRSVKWLWLNSTEELSGYKKIIKIKRPWWKNLLRDDFRKISRDNRRSGRGNGYFGGPSSILPFYTGWFTSHAHFF